MQDGGLDDRILPDTDHPADCRNFDHKETINMSTTNTIEQEIQARASVAPRVTPTDIEAEIVSEHHFTAYDGRQGALMHDTYSGRERPAGDGSDLIPLTLLTICVLVLRNGFTVTGESSCASPENFDADIGRRVARQNAINKVWPLLGFRLRDRLASV